MSEQVVRHRGGGRDEDGKLIPSSDVPLEAFAVASSGGHHQAQQGRNGEDIACTVYFTSFADLTNSDELTVDGQRYQIIVNKWRSPWPDEQSAIGGLEVLCTKGQG